MQLSVYELDDLAEEIRKRTGGDPLGMLAYANRTGGLHEMLAAIGLEDLLGNDERGRAKRIVVLGSSQTSVGKLRSIAADAGIGEGDIEFCLDYDQLKHYDFAKFRDRDGYRAVLFGPGPHSTPGKGESSSALDEMKNHPETYPPTIEIRERGGDLKITANSFKRAIFAIAAM